MTPPIAIPRPRHRPGLARAGFSLALLLGTLTASADVIDVNSGSDGDQVVGANQCSEIGNAGKCSLRAAITFGNGRTGAHTINVTVDVTLQNGMLTTLKAPFTINGNHHTIDGNGQGCFDLDDSGDNALGHLDGATGSQLLNLVIGRCNGHGISANGHDYVFQGNFIGVDATGQIAMPNTGHGISVSASHVYLDTSTNFLLGLYQNFPAQPVDESQIAAFSSQLATALASLHPVLIKDNVISGNGGNGVNIFSENIAAVTVATNLIGLDATGNAAIPNGGDGVNMSGSSFGNLIGPGNVISGNLGNGVNIDAGGVFLPNFVMGNRIGLSSGAPLLHVGNGKSGIRTNTKPSTNPASMNPSGTSLVIGPVNVIADNKGTASSNDPDTLGSDEAGILVTNTSKSVKILGNTIGLAEFPAGTPLASADYGNAGDGILVTSSGNTIRGNVIAANKRHGLVVRLGSTTDTGVFGNVIGASPAFAGNTTLGNAYDGIHVDAASTTTVGGSGAGEPNTIVANGRNGIALRNGGTGNGWSNLFRRNLAFGNARSGTGIDVDLERTKNLPDDTSEISANYANLGQSAPRICLGNEPSSPCQGASAPSSSGGTTTLSWTIDTHGPASFRIEFFAIDANASTAATQMGFLGEQSVSTDASGKPANSAACASGRCTISLPAPAGGRWIVATATDVSPLTDTPANDGSWSGLLACFLGNNGAPLPSCTVDDTSEYSNAATVPASQALVATVDASDIDLTTATLNATVSANGATTSVTFQYGTDMSYGETTTPIPVAGNAVGVPVAAPVANLSCGTTYHFRAFADNGIGGVSSGSDLSFATAPCAAGAPSATTLAASAIGTTTATLNGKVSANGAQTTVKFDYGTTQAYGGHVDAVQSPLAPGALGAAVSVGISGLACNTAYHFRVTADNGIVPSADGGDLLFTTAPCAAQPPTATTNAASPIGATTATLRGTVSANGAPTSVTFEYGLTTGYELPGSPIGAMPGSLAAGDMNVAVTADLAGLACGTTYHFRVVADNGVGGSPVPGANQTFTTNACPITPAATTGAASSISTTSATLNGLVSSNGAPTTVTFQYGTDDTYGGGTLAVPGTVPAGAIDAAVSTPLSGLVCNTTYHFRIVATNANGTAAGADASFATSACPPNAPTAATQAPGNVTANGATLRGLVSSNGASTTVTFEYGSNDLYGQSAAALESPLDLNAANAPVTAPLAGLSCGATYHYRVVATNIGGTVAGTDTTFTTAACPSGAPTAGTNAASAITATSATLSGMISSNGAATTVRFDYGPTASYGSQIAYANTLAANASNTVVSVAVTGLICNATYHFRVVAANASGSVNGNDATFTTALCPPGMPSATTTAATAVTATSATLNGLVGANGTPTTVAFEYGTSPNYGSGTLAATPDSLPADAVNAAVSLPLSGLACATTYHFRVLADNGIAASGNDAAFTTAPCALPTSFNGTTTTNGGTVVATITGGGPGCGFLSATMLPPPASPPAGASFPDGLFDFTAGGCSGPVTVTVDYPTAFAPNTKYWKYGATPDQMAPHWYPLDMASLAGHVATFTLTDGALGDDDGLADGVIRDPGGPAAMAPVDGGPGGDAKPVPTLGQAARLLLALLVLAFGLVATSRRRA